MSLTWPWALAALCAFPLLLALRWWMRRRRRRGALKMSSVALIRAALPTQSPWRRRIPLALFAAGLVFAGTAAARPQASVLLPSDSSSILLAMDVSASMCSTDVAPNRLTAAEAAAKDFIKAQHNGTRIGLVVFSGVAALVVPPTTDKNALVEAVGTLRTARGTAIGLGILAAIDAIAQVNPDVPGTGVAVAPVAPSVAGQYEPDSIVVLTDGANTQGVDPVTAAQQAAQRRLRIYTIGFGTTQPAPFVCTANQIGDSGFGGPRPPGGGRGIGGGGRFNQNIDVDTLTQVANVTGGKYFEAQDAKTLNATFQHLPTAIKLRHRKTELTVWFAFGGALFVLAALGLTQWWARPRPTRNS